MQTVYCYVVVVLLHVVLYHCCIEAPHVHTYTHMIMITSDSVILCCCCCLGGMGGLQNMMKQFQQGAGGSNIPGMGGPMGRQ